MSPCKQQYSSTSSTSALWSNNRPSVLGYELANPILRHPPTRPKAHTEPAKPWLWVSIPLDLPALSLYSKIKILRQIQ